MNCKNSAQNALKVAIFRLKIENFSGEGQCPLSVTLNNLESEMALILLYFTEFGSFRGKLRKSG